ncbi:MAG: histidine-type phosphatase, partial [Bacteroidales bacterium]|nr:histidine-type phosphatase [Bacteroidales bacterium]
MNRRILAVLSAIGICASALAQLDYNPEFMRILQEDHTRAGINTNSYEFGPIHDTKAPKGYKPFYISHYGRHG